MLVWERSPYGSAGPELAYPLVLVAVCAAGGFYLQASDAAQKTAPDLQPFATGEGQVTVSGHVMREGLVRDSPYGGKQESVDLESEELATADHVSHAHVGIRLTIYSRESDEAAAAISGSEPVLPVFTYGERMRFPAKLRMPRNYGNPGALDLAGYLASQGIRLTGSARAAQVEILPGFEGSRIGLWRAGVRRNILAHIQTLWPGERGALMQAMLIGGRAFFGRDIKTDFQRTGRTTYWSSRESTSESSPSRSSGHFASSLLAKPRPPCSRFSSPGDMRLSPIWARRSFAQPSC